MNETSRKKRLVILISAAVLALPAFGAGRLLGKASVKAAPEQAPLVVDERAEAAAGDAVSTQLATCQRKLARRKKVNSVTPDVTVEENQAQGPTLGQERQIEALEQEINTCIRSEMLHKASVCKTVRRHFDLMMALPDDGKGCRDKSLVVRHIKMNFEKCANFGDVPADLEAQDLTDEERLSVLDAVDVSKLLTKEELAQLDLIEPACLKKSGKRY